MKNFLDYLRRNPIASGVAIGWLLLTWIGLMIIEPGFTTILTAIVGCVAAVTYLIAGI